MEVGQWLTTIGVLFNRVEGTIGWGLCGPAGVGREGLCELPLWGTSAPLFLPVTVTNAQVLQEWGGPRGGLCRRARGAPLPLCGHAHARRAGVCVWVGLLVLSVMKVLEA